MASNPPPIRTPITNKDIVTPVWAKWLNNLASTIIERLTYRVDTGKSLTGGGDISTNLTLELVNDETNPLPQSYYGTDDLGSKGWHKITTPDSGTNRADVGFVFVEDYRTDGMSDVDTIEAAIAASRAKYGSYTVRLEFDGSRDYTIDSAILQFNSDTTTTCILQTNGCGIVRNSLHTSIFFDAYFDAEAILPITGFTYNVATDLGHNNAADTLCTVLSFAGGTNFAKLKVDQWCKVFSDDLTAGSNSTNKERRGENVRIAAINDTTKEVTIYGNILNTYTTSPYLVPYNNDCRFELLGFPKYKHGPDFLLRWTQSAIRADGLTPGKWKIEAESYESNGAFVATASSFGGQVDVICRKARTDSGDSGTSSGANVGYTFTDTAKTWGVDRFIGMTLTTTGGTGSGQSSPILSNTATALTLEGSLYATDATTTYTIGPSTYGYGYNDASGSDNRVSVFGIDVRHAYTNGVGSTEVGDISNAAIKNHGEVRNDTIRIGGLNCTAAAIDTHPSSYNCTFYLESGSTRGYAGDAGAQYSGLGLRGSGHKVHGGYFTVGRGINVNADYDDPDNSRDHQFYGPTLEVDSHYNGTDRYPISVIGQGAGNCRGIKIFDPIIILKGGGTTLPSVYVKYGELDIYNPQIISDGNVISYGNSHIFQAKNAGTIRVHGGRADMSHAGSGSGMDIARVENDDARIEILGDFTFIGGSAGVLRSILNMNSTTSGYGYVDNVVCDFAPTNGVTAAEAGGVSSNVSYTLIPGKSPNLSTLVEGSVTYDPPNLVDADGVTATVTVAGAVPGDDVVGCSFSNDLQGILLTPWVSGVDTVSIRFQNETGGTINLASGTLKAVVRKGWVRSSIVETTDDYKVFTGSSVAYDPPNILNGDYVAKTVTVTGAAVGDYANASFSIDLNGVILKAYVSAADTVTCVFQNETGSSRNLAAGDINVRVLKKVMLTGSATYNPPSLADTNGTNTTVTVTGAVLGDFVEAVSFSNDIQGMTLGAWVSAADTVSVRFQNESGGTVDLASGTLSALVRRNV